jgi:hypothetical protein
LCDEKRVSFPCPAGYFTGLKNDKANEGKNLSKANARAKRSAISNLYKDYGQSSAYKANIHSCLGQDGQGGFQGLLRLCTATVRDGDAEVREGKDPLPFTAFRDLSERRLMLTSCLSVKTITLSKATFLTLRLLCS